MPKVAQRRKRRSRSLPSRPKARRSSSFDSHEDEFQDEIELVDVPSSPPTKAAASLQIPPKSISPTTVRRRWTVDYDQNLDDDEHQHQNHHLSIDMNNLQNRQSSSSSLRSPSSNHALPDWLFEVEDDFENSKSLLDELGIYPKRYFNKIIWVLVWTWLPRGKAWEGKVAMYLSQLGASLDPAVLASSEDFWGSFGMVFLYASSHYNRGQFRVLPWVILIWFIGSAFLRFVILAREQSHKANVLELVKIQRTSQTYHNRNNLHSLSSTPEDDVLLLSSASLLVVDQYGCQIQLVECLSATGFAIIPLTLTVLLMGLIHPPRSVCYIFELIGVAWSSRAVSVALRTRTRPDRNSTNHHESVSNSEEDPLQDVAFAQYFREGHRQDHLLLLFPIVLLNVYFVSLYTRN